MFMMTFAEAGRAHIASPQVFPSYRDFLRSFASISARRLRAAKVM